MKTILGQLTPPHDLKKKNYSTLYQISSPFNKAKKGNLKISEKNKI